ncbi:hypothetical protein [Microcoleus sp. herbarium5]|uniref:hypothetical protein n=1 Tax=Microcoleus sp. herbarium5 TaxID=3055434 RepID=UPI002FD2816D
MKKLIAALIAFAAIVLPQSAIAQYNAPHKYTDAFGKTKVYIPGTPNIKEEYTTTATRTSTTYYDRCGWAHISLGSSIPVSVSSTNVSILPIVFTNSLYSPVCTPELPSGSWLTREPNGSGTWNTTSIIITSPNLSPKGYSYYNSNLTQLYIKFNSSTENPTVAGSATVNIAYSRAFKVNINSCGYGTITVSATRPMTTFKVAGVDYTLANLPVATKPMICRTQGNSKIRYVPLNP